MHPTQGFHLHTWKESEGRLKIKEDAHLLLSSSGVLASYDWFPADQYFCQFGVNLQTLSQEPRIQILSHWLYGGIDKIQRQNFWYQRDNLFLYRILLWLTMCTSLHSAFETILPEENGSLKDNNLGTFNEIHLNILFLFCFVEGLTISNWFIDFLSKINPWCNSTAMNLWFKWTWPSQFCGILIAVVANVFTNYQTNFTLLSGTAQGEHK